MPTPTHQKPTIIVITPTNNHTYEQDFPAILTKLRHSANLTTASSPQTLYTQLTTSNNPIAGFLIPDDKIMDPEHTDLASHLANLLRMANKEWTLVFALAFPQQAAHKPLLFSRFMDRFFNLKWKICGLTTQTVRLELRERTLRKMGLRIYRAEFFLRGVFLRWVKLADKVLIMGGCALEYHGSEGISFAVAARENVLCHGVQTTLEEDWGGDSGVGVEGRGRVRDTVDTADLEVSEVGGDDEENWADDEGEKGDDGGVNDDEDERAESGSDSSPTSESPPSVQVISSSSSVIEYPEPSPLASAYENEGDFEQEDAEDEKDEEEAQEEAEEEQDDDDDDEDKFSRSIDSKYVPSDDEGDLSHMQVADCPVAIHEVKSWIMGDEEEIMVRGYVGFVGHVDDTRSVASLILGMFAIG